MRVELGDEAEDKVSGFRGVVVALFLYLNGCTRVCLQPKVGADGKLPESATFDEPQLEVLKKAVVSCGPRTVGGPAPYVDRGR